MENLCSQDWGSQDTRSSAVNIRPADSYFVMIGKAIVSSCMGRMALHEIYNYIKKNYPYFKRVNPAGWKNSVRHNLSLHECFIKVGKCEECKGHYWGIHPANIQDFSRGDFHRRKAKAKARLGYAMEAQKAVLPKGMLWNYQYYSSVQWPSTTYNNYNFLTSPVSQETRKGSTDDKSLKFNISNLIDIH